MQEHATTIPNKISTPSPLFPPATKRPTYIVIDDTIGDHQPGVYYCWASAPKPIKDKTTSKKLYEAELHNDWIASPIKISHLLDLPDGVHGLQLTIKPGQDGGDKKRSSQWITINIEASLLANQTGMDEIRRQLIENGAQLSGKQKDRMRLFDYLCLQRPQSLMTAETSSGWSRLPKTYTLPNASFGTHATTTTLLASKDTKTQYSAAGTIPGWDQLAHLATTNPLLLLALSAAFTGPLLKILNIDGCGIHFVGGSSTGKTSLISAAASVWGPREFVRSWKATSNGIEAIACAHNDNLLALDEISECDPKYIGDIVYALGNGLGKQRADQTGSQRPVKRWRCMTLSSGEKGLATAMGHTDIKTGQMIRLIDVPVARPYGAFDDLMRYPNGAHMADAIRDISTRHHGIAGKLFLTFLCDQVDFNTIITEHQHIIATLLEDITPNDTLRRASTRLAAIATAACIAIEAGIVPWSTHRAINAAKLALQGWINEQSDDGSGDHYALNSPETRQIVRQIDDFISQYGDGKFGPANVDDKSAPQDRAGWWRTGKNGQREYLLTAKAMREDAMKGFDLARAARTLVELGRLIPGAERKDRQSEKIRLTQSIRIAGHGVQRLYVITTPE